MQRITMNGLGDLPPCISIEEAGRVIGYKRTRAYMEANRTGGLIPTIETGPGRRVVPTALLLRNLGIDH